jgi:uroporphyrinogen-III synthase
MEPPPRLLLTRPEAAGRRFLAACEAAGGMRLPAILSPVMEIRPVEVALAARPVALILTSENGARRAGELGLPPLEAWCVGARTAEAARMEGFLAREAGPDAEALLRTIIAQRPRGLLLHLRGEHARGDLVRRLRENGLEAAEAIGYRQEALPPTPEAREALAGSGPLVVPLFSPRSAALLAAWSPRAPLHVLAMSEAVAAEAADRLNPRRLTALPVPSGAAMVAATLDRLRELADSVP